MSNAVAVALGSIVSLWRYPVKSMMGEELNATEVAERGLLGDRAYALVDSSDGKVATAKNPRKWPRLFDFRATVIEPARAAAKVPPVRIALPDGTTVTSVLSRKYRLLSVLQLICRRDHLDGATNQALTGRTGGSGGFAASVAGKDEHGARARAGRDYSSTA